MKTCEDVVNNLLERRRQYRLQHSRKRRTVVTVISCTSCLCLAVLLGTGLWQSGAQNQPLAPEDTPQSGSVENRIITNRLDEPAAYREKLNINLSWDDFVLMDAAQLQDYYGVDIFPQVPQDLTSWDTAEDFGGHGVFRRDKGKGEVYWDQVVLNYSNPDFTRSVNLEVAKGRLPFVCFAMDKDYENSVISGTQVYLGLTDAGYYHAQFFYGDAGFVLTAQGLTEEEVVAMIESLCNPIKISTTAVQEQVLSGAQVLARPLP